MSIVNEWPMVRLGETAEIRTSQIRPESLDGKTAYLGLEHLNKGGGIIETSNVAAAELKSSKYPFSDQAVLFGKLRPNLRKVALPYFSGVCSTDILPIYPSESVHRNFLYHYLLTEPAQAFIRNRVTGINLPRTSPKALRELLIPLPPIAEQQRIAEILDNATSLIEASTAKINGLNELEESSFLFLFGDESVSTTTEEVAAKYKNSIRTGPFGSQLKHGEFVNEGISVLGLDNVVSNQFRWASPRFITPEKYEQLKRYTVHPGDVLISIMGTTGRCAIVPYNLPTTINTKHICAITTDRARMSPEFLRAAFLWHPEVRQSLRQQTKGAIMAGLNMGIIRNLPLPAPEMSQQRAWSEFTSEINKLRENLLEQELLSRELHQTLATRAFAGEL